MGCMVGKWAGCHVEVTPYVSRCRGSVSGGRWQERG